MLNIQLIKDVKSEFVDISTWKEFVFEDLFCSENGDFDIQKKHIEENGIFVVSSGVTNNGIIGKSTINAKIFNKNTLTVDMFGNSYFRNYKYMMVTHGRVFSLSLIKERDYKASLFLVALLNKTLPFKYNYNNMCSWNKLGKEKILLPSRFNSNTNKHEPDWEYMENYIDFLQNKIYHNTFQEYIFNVKNFKTKKEDMSLWKEYKLETLLIIKGSKTTPKIILEKIGLGKYPYITTTAENQGVSGYYDYFTETGNVLTFDSAVLGTCFYQEQNFSASDHVELGIPKCRFNKKIGLFLQTIINKTNEGIYHYGHKANQKRIRETIIKLPSILNEKTKEYEPDWDYMENYIDLLEQEIFK